MKFVVHNVAETGLTIKFVEQINTEDRFTAHNRFQNVGTLLIVKFFVHDVCRTKYDTISFGQFRRKYIGTSPVQGTPPFRAHKIWS